MNKNRLLIRYTSEMYFFPFRKKFPELKEKLKASL